MIEGLELIKEYN